MTLPSREEREREGRKIGTQLRGNEKVGGKTERRVNFAERRYGERVAK